MGSPIDPNGETPADRVMNHVLSNAKSFLLLEKRQEANTVFTAIVRHYRSGNGVLDSARGGRDLLRASASC